MKRTIIIFCIIAFFGGNILKGQDSLSRFKIGVGCYYGKTSVSRDCIFPSILLSLKKHVFIAGPSVYYLTPQGPKPIMGAHLGYQYYPNGIQKRFSLFFEYDLNYLQGNIDQSELYWYYYGNRGYSEVTIQKVDLSNYLGFGFRLKLIQNFYLNLNTGIGFLSFYKDVYKYTYWDGKVAEGTGKLAMKDWSQLTGLAKVGICWDVVRVRKTRD